MGTITTSKSPKPVRRATIVQEATKLPLPWVHEAEAEPTLIPAPDRVIATNEMSSTSSVRVEETRRVHMIRYEIQKPLILHHPVFLDRVPISAPESKIAPRMKTVEILEATTIAPRLINLQRATPIEYVRIKEIVEPIEVDLEKIVHKTRCEPIKAAEKPIYDEPDEAFYPPDADW